MEFKYEYGAEKLECVAYMTHMKGCPKKECLVVKDTETGKTIWFYYDGDVFTQPADLWDPEKATKKFYKGDKVEVTF